MRLPYRPMMAPKYGELFFAYDEASLYPSATSAILPSRSGPRRDTTLGPKVIARTSMPCALVSVKSSTAVPSGSVPNGVRTVFDGVTVVMDGGAALRDGASVVQASGAASESASAAIARGERRIGQAGA